ncbi:MAG: DNA polymerase III subunit alpha [Bacteroidota bacterium]
MQFSHLHTHTQFSLLDGAASITNLLYKAKNNGMKAMAITDHGNMFGVPRFVSEAKKHDIKPIIGCEFYLARGSRFDKTKGNQGDEKNTFHQLILAKNAEGYRNLSILCSKGYTEGYYYKPRIDKELIREYRGGLIATTCCLASEINQCILHKGEAEAEVLFKEWLDIFGEDYYIELQRHDLPEQNTCNRVLEGWAKKYNVKAIATNDVHYVNMEDAEAQDILLCLQTGKDFHDPNRMRFHGNMFFMKSTEEMEALFKDMPEALENTQEIVDKIETPSITRDILLPVYALPEGFTSEIEYLRHLTFLGAKKKYSELSESLSSRLDFELKVIADMGFAGYFLIVQDFTSAARNLGVTVGPGRGSAAGSAVAYCIGITNIDPIKYDLLFERFLNPERVSMPDIDIDFDDDGRQKVIDYVVDKYGKERVAQIVTFGTMAARSAIKDVGRVLNVKLADTDRLSKLVPETLGVTLKKAFEEVKELREEKNNGSDEIKKTLRFAEILEGSARHTGIHAAGVIIAPDKLENYIPLCTAKDADLLVTQYDGKYVESAGMLKMDFLGLKTLSIINDAIINIKKSKGVSIDIETIPLDDPATFALYQRGDTVGTFQFESEGMQQYLRDLKPSNIEDLIAMNALFRPGPMQFIPSFINRKHGVEKVEYPHPMLEDILKHTYGIMVYQEQIMQTAQVMGGFTLGGADLLRRAMGKKDAKTMEQQKEVFIKGAAEKQVDASKATEVFEIMQKFAEYGFNRSHSAAYSVVAYQTAYLKANFPAEYMAAVLTRNMSDIKKITFFIDECRRQGIAVLGPDVNESDLPFSVNRQGQIRFGLAAVKGVGELAVQALIDERANGNYTGIFDLAARVNLRALNKRCFESLVYSGAFDVFTDMHRAQYFAADVEQVNLIEKAIRYGNAVQESKKSTQINMFGETEEGNIPTPPVPAAIPWTKMTMLSFEKEVIGFYLSGHPLDSYQPEIKEFCMNKVSDISDTARYRGREITFPGIITSVNHRTNKSGAPFANFTIEDFDGSSNLFLFSENYLRFKHLLVPDTFVFVMARIEQRQGQENVYEAKIINMIHLDEVAQVRTKQVLLSVHLNDMSESLVNHLCHFIEKNPGNITLKLAVIDSVNNARLEMIPKKNKILINHETLHRLYEMEDVTITVNP